MWARGSPRCWAAAMAMRRLSLILSWPTYSARRRGRREVSSARSSSRGLPERMRSGTQALASQLGESSVQLPKPPQGAVVYSRPLGSPEQGHCVLTNPLRHLAPRHVRSTSGQFQSESNHLFVRWRKDVSVEREKDESSRHPDSLVTVDERMILYH